MAETDSTAHLEPRMVAAYAAGTLDGADRAHIERHLAHCHDCVAEVVAIHRMRPRRRWPRQLIAAGLAAAAVLAVWIGAPRRPPPQPADSIRGPGAPSVPHLDVVRPADGGSLGDSGFVWHAIKDAVTYRLTITDDAGDEISSQTTADTASTRPASVPLLPARTYFWYVDALKRDGASATSGVRRFHVAR